MDYSTLDQLSRSLTGLFWAKIEALAPGQPDLRISADLYKRWREALGAHQNGRKQREEFEHILRAVRSFYTDLHSWAVEEPEKKWAPWVAPCPIPDGALRGVIVRQRRRKGGWTTGCASANHCCPCSWPTSRTATATYRRCCRQPRP
jgi:hypothetical protein